MSHAVRSIMRMKFKRPYVQLAIEIEECLAANDHVEAFSQHKGRWIKATREALGYSAVALARKLNISQPSLFEKEEREACGAISIKKLEAIAQAMNCKFVYGFVPNESLADVAADLETRQEHARQRHRRIPRPA